MVLPSRLKGPITHPGKAGKSSPLLCARITASIRELLTRPLLALIGTSTLEYKAERSQKLKKRS